MEVLSRLYINSDPLNSQIPGQTEELDVHGDSGNTVLAEEAVVHDHPTIEHRGSITSSSNPGSILTGPVPISSTRKATPNGLAIESERLLDQGCSLRVVDTLQQARKKSTNNTYNRIWERFTTDSLLVQQSWDPLSPTVSQILEFLQLGLERGPS